MKQIASNKKAFFNYFIEDKFEAGIALVGSEVKSLRAGKCSLVDSFVSINGGEVFLKNCQISVYDKAASAFKPDEKRARKLLLSKEQIKKLEQKSKTKGYTIVPTKIYLNSKGLVKLEIALAKGKQMHDKKEVIKAKDIDREVARELSYNKKR